MWINFCVDFLWTGSSQWLDHLSDEQFTNTMLFRNLLLNTWIFFSDNCLELLRDYFRRLLDLDWIGIIIVWIPEIWIGTVIVWIILEKKLTASGFGKRFFFLIFILNNIFFFCRKMDSDDSQADIFATQLPNKKKEFQTSSAPLYMGPKPPSNFVYTWLIIFKWGGDINNPFELLSVDDLEDGELDPKFLSGILSPTSRMRHRDLSFYPDFAISIFAKIEKCKSTFVF